MPNLESTVFAQIGWNWQDGAEDNSKASFKKSFLNGSGHDQADAVWWREDVALTDGSANYWELDQLARTILGRSVTINFTRIKAILIINSGSSDGDLIVGGSEFDTWWAPFGSLTDTVECPVDSPLMLCNRKDGWLVTGEGGSSSSSSGESGADRVLKVAASGGAATYDIAIIGAEAEFVSSSSAP